MPSRLALSKTCSQCQKVNVGVGTHLSTLFAINLSLRATGLPYYFLGRVPCRSVSFVAIVVGAVAYERRVVYTREPLQLSPVPQPIKPHFTVDDGTATIECAFRPDDEDKPQNKREKWDVARFAQELANKPPPLVPVGSVVRVQGKVRVKHNSRDIHGDSIGLCFFRCGFT